MTVLSESWWSVFWFDMTVWLLALGSLVALFVIAGQERRRARRTAGLDVTTKACVYLDDKGVMDLYRMGRYSEALTQEVERRISRSVRAGGELPGTPVGLGADAAEERINRYVQTHAPIDVIGVIVKTLERGDGIVHANLRAGSVRKNRALQRWLEALEESGSRPSGVRLSEAEDYVLIRGQFRAVEPAPGTPAGTTVFLAPYADPEDLSRMGQVRITCATAGLAGGEDHRQTIASHCLGTVDGWNAAERLLEVHAIALFR
ncbi:hypothetical protein [Kitasatospora sp. NPDC093806]|uniref:hypothetical protein n=1 Tax=Kitasatospora sp. NPDC093806 TaxID=3155075 RepID=UPI00342A3D07